MPHFFFWLAGYRWPLLLALFATVSFAVALYVQGAPLAQRVSGGILAYEFAWTRARAAGILAAWSRADAAKQEQSLIKTARLQLWLDFGFLLAYPLLLSLLCSLLAESQRNRMAVVGAFVSWAILFAAPLDAIENLALLRMLSSGASEGLARLAGWCAGVKFLLVYAALGYFVLQGVAVLINKMRAGPA